MTNESDQKSCVIIGLGYIGLPTAVVVARSGMSVTGVDIDQRTVDAVNAGRCPIEEPLLPAALAVEVAAGRIRARTTPCAGDVFIIAVPTPFTGGYKPDLAYVEAATRSITPVLAEGNLVIVESTIPVGATEQVARWIEELRPDLACPRRDGEAAGIFITHCPERVLPGQMLKELVENDRVIGGITRDCGAAGKAFYSTFVTGRCLVTDTRTAELCKLCENSFRDVNIAFANELSELCEDLGIDVWELIGLANHHPRVNILKPGPGVGGHCIAVDPWFIVSSLGEKARLIREARWINSGRPRQIVRKVLDRISTGSFRSIGVFGLAYKPNVDDLRESPAVEVVEFLARELHLSGRPVDLRICEPFVEVLPHELEDAPGAHLVDAETALGADFLLMLVDHDAFRRLPPDRVEAKPRFDTRGLWPRESIARRGFASV